MEEGYALREFKSTASPDTCPALDDGAFKSEITKMELSGGKRGSTPEIFDQDEHPRPQSTLDSLAKLPPVFSKGGQVTAGNASGVSLWLVS